MSYSSLPDPVVSSTESFYKAVVNFKFCSLGLVVSNTWTAGYCTVLDGVLRLYDSRETGENNPNNGWILKIPLTNGYFCSAIKGKIYNETGIELFGFSLMYDYGIMVPLKQIKLSCMDKDTARQLSRIIEVNSN